MKAHKNDDGFRMFCDRHVEAVELGTIQDESGFCFVRGKV
jgi:hypothetical protein